MSKRILTNALTVVTIHGFAAHWTAFAPCSLYLRSRGYSTEHWGYSTFTQSIEEAAAKFSEQLTKVDARGERFFIVAHSMGGIVMRVALQRTAYKNLAGQVLIAPPIRGTPVTRLVPGLVRRWIPALKDLSDGPEGIHHRLKEEVSVPTLVVAARYDLLVPISATHLDCRHEYCVFSGTHNSLLIDPRVFFVIHRFFKEVRTNA